MAVITPDTFDPANRFVAVRFAQGTPLCDCDLNEEVDIRRHEAQLILRDIVGNGAPDGSDGFRIAGTGASNDVAILRGPAGPAAGLLILDGRLLRLPADTTLRGQPLHISQTGSTDLAARLGTVVVPEIPTPGADGSITVYLDVWDRLLDAAEDPSLILGGLGVESSARLRREFAVRWRAATGIPVSGDSDFEAEHSYLALAGVARRAGDDQVGPSDVTDLRRTRVATPTRHDFDQMATDAFGAAYTVDGTAPRLGFSLRDIINAMLRDGRPAIVGPHALKTEAVAFPNIIYLPGGLRRLIWRGPSSTPGANALFTQDELPGGGFAGPVEGFDLTGGLGAGSLNAVIQPDGAIWAIYQGSTGGADEIYARRHEAGVWAPEVTLSSGGDNANPAAAVDEAGNVHVVWRDSAAGTQLRSTMIAPGATTGGALATADSAAAGGVLTTLSRDPVGGVRLAKAEVGGGLPPLWSLETKRWVPATGAWEAGFEAIASNVFSLDLALTSAPTMTGETVLGFTVRGNMTFDLETARIEAAPGGLELTDRRRLVRATAADPSEIPLGPRMTVDPDGNVRLAFHTTAEFREFALVFRV